jgi:hypothetical protein
MTTTAVLHLTRINGRRGANKSRCSCGWVSGQTEHRISAQDAAHIHELAVGAATDHWGTISRMGDVERFTTGDHSKEIW